MSSWFLLPSFSFCRFPASWSSLMLASRLVLVPTCLCCRPSPRPRCPVLIPCSSLRLPHLPHCFPQGSLPSLLSLWSLLLCLQRFPQLPMPSLLIEFSLYVLPQTHTHTYTNKHTHTQRCTFSVHAATRRSSKSNSGRKQHRLLRQPDTTY